MASMSRRIIGQISDEKIQLMAVYLINYVAVILFHHILPSFDYFPMINLNTSGELQVQTPAQELEIKIMRNINEAVILFF